MVEAYIPPLIFGSLLGLVLPVALLLGGLYFFTRFTPEELLLRSPSSMSMMNASMRRTLLEEMPEEPQEVEIEVESGAPILQDSKWTCRDATVVQKYALMSMTPQALRDERERGR